MSAISNRDLAYQARRRNIIDQFNRGLLRITHNYKYAPIAIAYTIISYVIWNNRKTLFVSDESLIPALTDVSNDIMLVAVFITLLLIIIMICGYIPGTYRLSDRLKEAGVVNHADIPPSLIEKKKDKENKKVTVWMFHSAGIPLSVWQEQQQAIETAMNVTIIKIKPDAGKSIMCVYSVPAIGDLPDVCIWDDKYLPDKESMLACGEGITGTVTIDLDKTPHILIGGSTGSGKSVLLKLLLYEDLQHDARVIIIDFKGGVDYGSYWDEHCTICTDIDITIKELQKVVAELTLRSALLKSSGYTNISDYNRTHEKKIQRIIFACDELAELMDKTGADKDKKAKLATIENLLSTIARLGRAFNINLLLATQRPDANILPGQIKNNCDIRICGRADNVLSQIILDTTDASDMIPIDLQGRFLMSDGTLFQAYYLDDRKLIDRGLNN